MTALTHDGSSEHKPEPITVLECVLRAKAIDVESAQEMLVRAIESEKQAHEHVEQCKAWLNDAVERRQLFEQAVEKMSQAFECEPNSTGQWIERTR